MHCWKHVADIGVVVPMPFSDIDFWVWGRYHPIKPKAVAALRGHLGPTQYVVRLARIFPFPYRRGKLWREKSFWLIPHARILQLLV